VDLPKHSDGKLHNITSMDPMRLQLQYFENNVVAANHSSKT
jgi:hypothetical protein